MIYNLNLFKITARRKLISSLSILSKVIIVVPVSLAFAFFIEKHLIFSLSKIVEALGIIILLLGLATILEKYKFGLINLLSGAIVLVIGLNFLTPVVYGLSTEEKLEDFDYLYTVISENYPLLSANERVFGFNWLEKEQLYRRNIEHNTKDESGVISNSMYAAEMGKITRELYNNLTHPITRNFFWGHQVLTNPQYSNNFELWNEVLKDENVLSWYDFQLAEGQEPPTPYAGIGIDFVHADNYRRNIRSFRTGIVVPGEVAYLRVFGMSDLRVEADGKLIREFLEEIKDYNQLLIDVRDNGGGIDEYWMQNLVAPLIKEELSVDNYFFVRGEYSKRFYDSRGIELFPVTELDSELLASFPEGIEEGFQYYGIHTVSIESKNPVDFKGDIYLLTNRGSHGSTERFANFVRGANLATIVGDFTACNAPIFEPILFSLPNSGMVIRYRGELVINSDGNISSHVGIVPDVRIFNSTVKAPAYQVDEVVNYILQNR